MFDLKVKVTNPLRSIGLSIKIELQHVDSNIELAANLLGQKYTI